MTTFKDRLALGLTLTGAATQEVRSGEIKVVDLHLTNAGWSGTLEFDIYDDAKAGGKDTDNFFPSYLESKLIKVELKIADYLSDKTESTAPPLTLKGLVTKRVLREIPLRSRPITSPQILTRRYRIEVADAAQVLWKQHHPCKLYADKTLEYIITDQKSDLIKFNCTWSWVGNAPYKTPMVFFALDPSIGPASFYDWVMWYVDRNRLIWAYNCRTDEYSIEEQKTAAGTAIPVSWLDFVSRDAEREAGLPTISALDLAGLEQRDPIRRRGESRAESDAAQAQARQVDLYEPYERGYTIDVPEVPRYSGAVLDTCTYPIVEPELIDNADAADPKIKRHTLLRTPLSADVTQRAALERARLVPNPEPELTLNFNRMPVKPLYPGDQAEFLSPGGGWSSDAWPVKQQLFRVFDVVLRARAIDMSEAAGYRQLHTWCNVDYHVRLEVNRDLTTPRLPAFVEPTYPVFVEARVLSSIEGETPPVDSPPNPDVSLTYEYKRPLGPFVYRVQVPLWADSAPEITAPYDPGRMPGQMFFPAYKDERIVLGMTWRKAWVDSFVDWRDGVTFPSDMQGNQLFLGKKPTSRTWVRNYYENEGSLLPIFEIERKHTPDYQKVKISEGKLLIEVNEE